MDKYIPDNMPAGAPIVVVLHGCTQNGWNYHHRAGWRVLSDRNRFALLVPTQRTGVWPYGNNPIGCFNWFESGDYRRGVGESASIVNAMNKVIADHGLNASRAYVSGLSGGAAMSIALIGSYPEKFKAAAVNAGVAYACANDAMVGLYWCMPGYDTWDAVTLGNRVRNANPGYTGPWAKVQVFHGTSDQLVNFNNMTSIVNQWTNVHGIDQTADETGTIGTATFRKYKNSSGTVLVESYTFTGMRHAQAVDPGAGATQCGEVNWGDEYFVDRDVCTAYVAAKFWGLAP